MTQLEPWVVLWSWVIVEALSTVCRNLHNSMASHKQLPNTFTYHVSSMPRFTLDQRFRSFAVVLPHWIKVRCDRNGFWWSSFDRPCGHGSFSLSAYFFVSSSWTLSVYVCLFYSVDEFRCQDYMSIHEKSSCSRTVCEHSWTENEPGPEEFVNWTEWTERRHLALVPQTELLNELSIQTGA